MGNYLGEQRIGIHVTLRADEEVITKLFLIN